MGRRKWWGNLIIEVGVQEVIQSSIIVILVLWRQIEVKSIVSLRLVYFVKVKMFEVQNNKV